MPIKSKPDLLFYAVMVFMESDFIKDRCLLCGYKPVLQPNAPLLAKPPHPLVGICFYYYNHLDMEQINSNFDICLECFKVKIEDKPLDELKSLIPILKMRGKRLGHLVSVYYRDNVLDDINGVYDKKYAYSLIISEGTLNEYIKRIDNG